MGSNRLQNDDTSKELCLCDWHLRRIFNERVLNRITSGELATRMGEIKPRRNPTSRSPAPYNQEFVVYDPTSNQEVARCHQFLEADKKTLGGSMKPDPKQVIVDGIDYHLLGKQNTNCPHCQAGISTYVDPPTVP